jgi:NTP pyrophosphatase (non-canonical NTP hydrolase)
MSSSQERVRALTEQYNLESKPHVRLLDLSAECGELAKEFLVSTHYGQKDFQPTEHWEAELGDVYFSLLCLADATGVKLEQALEKTFEKYRKRFETSGQIGSS